MMGDMIDMLNLIPYDRSNFLLNKKQACCAKAMSVVGRKVDRITGTSMQL